MDPAPTAARPPRPGAIRVERRFDAAAEVVWGFLADSDRLDRLLGMPPADYTWELSEGGERQRVARARQAGVEMEWVEPGYEWVAGRFLSGQRRYRGGPIRAGGLDVEVEPLGPRACLAAVTAWGERRSALLRALGPLLARRLRSRLQQALDAVAGEVARVPDDASPSAPALEARRVLLTHDGILTGARTPAAEGQLARRLGRLRELGVAASPAAALARLLKELPDDEVAQMRPLELAPLLEMGDTPVEVVRLFLAATRAGLLELAWHVDCPACNVAAAWTTDLSEIGRKVHCEACDIAYDVDFGARVEALFRPHQAVRAVQARLYCASSPAFRPHVLAQLRLAPGQRRRFELPVTAGRLALRVPGVRARAEVEAQSGGRLRATVGPEGARLELEPVAGAAALSVELDADPALARPSLVTLERVGSLHARITGADMVSHPEFLDLFAAEAPAAGLDLSIRRLALLFSDLTGSTALYERIGDARAFAVVQEHFQAMAAVVSRHGGAVVKTMGDAVMASFPAAHQAVAAAREMAREAARLHGDLGIGVKLGAHEGPCLAVQANGRLDFFGTTVNLAARLQGQAGPGVLVVHRELADDPEVHALLGPARRGLRAELKGLAGEQELLAIDLLPRPPT